MNVHSLCADRATSMKEERVTKFVLSVKQDISASKVKKLQPTLTLIFFVSVYVSFSPYFSLCYVEE